jgi:hypothetical protein
MELKDQLASMTPLERAEFIKNNATSVEDNQHYTRPLTPEEVTQAKEEYAETGLLIADKTEVFDEIKAAHKKEMKDLLAIQKEKQKMYKNKVESKKGILYHFADQKASTMTIVDIEGNIILERRLRPDEKQTSMLGMSAAM